MKIKELLESEDDTHRIIAFHGGKDFDEIDPKKFGSGKPGGIRPLGKGLYCGLAVTPDDLYSAIELAKVYAEKYGGKTPTIHGFEANLPGKIKNLGYDNRGWARTGAGKEEWEAEALPWVPKIGAAKAKEAAFVNISLLRRIGKWPANTPTEQIVKDVS